MKRFKGTVKNNVIVLENGAHLPDGTTVRYYLTGAFAAGQVDVAFQAGTWQDKAGNLGIAGTQSFQVIERLSDTGTQEGSPPPSKVFFIELLGGFEYYIPFVFDKPVFAIRGHVTIEIGKVTENNQTKTRFKLDAGGSVEVIQPVGNIAAGAAKFVLETGDNIGDAQLSAFVAGRLAEQYPETNAERRVVVEGFQEFIVKDLKPSLFVLLLIDPLASSSAMLPLGARW